MSELARYRPAEATYPYRAARDVVDGWAERWSAVLELVPYIAKSEFVPTAMRDNKAQIAACILAGREIGLGPMASLQHINVIEGRPGLSAHMQRALAQAAGAEIVYDEMTSGRCVVRGRRSPEHGWTTVVWDLGMAQQMGIAGKGNWRKMPRQMLIARATGELCRLIAADALMGMAYNLDELADVGVEAEPQPPKRTAVRRKAPAGEIPGPALGPARAGSPAGETAAPPPPRDDVAPSLGVPLPGEDGYDELARLPADLVTDPRIPDEVDEVVLAPARDRDTENERTREWAMTEPQRKAMGAAFNDLGLGDNRELALAVVARVINRSIATRNELTRGEYRQLMDTLATIRSSRAMAAELRRIAAAEEPLAELEALFRDLSGPIEDDDDES